MELDLAKSLLMKGGKEFSASGKQAFSDDQILECLLQWKYINKNLSANVVLTRKQLKKSECYLFTKKKVLCIMRMLFWPLSPQATTTLESVIPRK